ncbi:MAG: peptide ABC transporter substrate-binding protein [Lachnospiraceae bacterium]|nr:peptide ABC transporter substrate-binding protein [Lachnospiraceae bacterium]
MKKLFKKWSLLLFSAAFTITMTSGCKKQQINQWTKAASSEEENVLSYSVLSKINSLDPQKLNQMVASTIGYHIYEGLVRNDNGKIVKAGAKSYQISEDGLVYTFTLRKAYWKNTHSLVTAQDYVRGIQRLVDEKTESDYGFLGYYIKNGAAVQQGAFPVKKLGVRALDDETLEIRLEKKTDYFLKILSLVQFSPVPEEALKEAGDYLGTSAEYLYENGPFYVDQWEGDQIVLKKNEDYWNAEEVFLDQVVITRKGSIKEVKEAYQKGETNLLTSLFPSSKEEDYTSYTDGQLVMVKLNLDHKKLADRNFRKALLYSIDQNQLNKEVFEGLQEASFGYVLPELLNLSEDETRNRTTSYDPERAKQYMEKVKKKWKWNDKKPWKLTLICSDSELRQQIAAYLKESWEKNLGIQVEIQDVSSDERWNYEASGEYDMILTKWVPDYDDPTAYLENWKSDSPYNQGHYSSKEFDKKMDQAATKSGSGRLTMLSEAEQILIEDVPAIPLYFRKKVLTQGENVKGVSTYYIGYQYNFIHGKIE